MKCFKRIIAGSVLILSMLAGLFLGHTTDAEARTISGSIYSSRAVDPITHGEGFTAVLYDNQNGLPTSEANAVAETKEGFIWIGSYSGLIRYDGNTFERMDSTTGVSSVVCLFVDSKDRLWVGTNDNGVAVYEKGEFRLWDTGDGLRSSSVRSITEDEDGNIYVASTHGLNIIDKDMNMRDISEKQLDNEYICELRLGPNNVIYGETLDGDIFTVSNGQLSAFYGSGSLGIEAVYCILPDEEKDGYVYLGTTESEVYYGYLDGTLVNPIKYDVSPLKNITSIEKFEDQLWVCADNGMSIIDASGVPHKLENIPMDNSIEHVLVDYEGNIWATSSRQGIMKLVPNQFTNLFEKYNLETRVVNATCIYNDKLCIGTDTGLIVVDGEGVLKEIPVTFADPSDEFASCTNLIELLDNCRIRSIIRDSKNRLWFCSYSSKGLVCYDNGVITRFDSGNGLPSNKARTAYERKDGVMMVACSGGLVLIENGKITHLYNEDSGLNNMEVLSVTEAENGDMIIGSDGNGIYIIKDHKVTNLGKKDGLSSEVVMRVKKDKSRNIFWIVTSNSIGYMTEDYKITTIKNFPYSNNFDMYENNQGEMWILSSNGIYVTSVDELLKNDEIHPVYFSMSNGLSCVATANSYSDISDKGDLFISGTTGVAKVNIEDTMLNVSEIKMSVPYIEADGEYIYPDANGKFVIPSATDRITIYNFVYTYSLVNPKITYWLEGFDKKLITMDRSDMEPVVYTNLEGGTYQFIMILQDALGKGGKQIEVTIVKNKAFYEKAWFKLLTALAIIVLVSGTIVAIVRLKTRQLKKTNEKNKQFINEMINAFAKTIDMKDKYTNGHSQRVADYTAMLTEELGYDEETVERYRNIALLHDIGKISIPPEVLNKQGKLTEKEFNIIKSHSAQGYMALKDISIMPELAIGAGQHHERPDGKGYPKGLTLDKIDRVAQIIAVADTFDAMYSDRPYRKRMNFEKAVSIIKEVSGTQLTSDVVDAFVRLVNKGYFKAEDDDGGGSTEDINNIHKKQEKENKEKA